MATAVAWFRRDLRLSDNPALLHAVDAGGDDGVVALFVLDPLLLERAGAARRAFLLRCLRALDESIGGRLVVRTGAPATVVPEVAVAAGATTVVAAEDAGPYGRDRDAAVDAELRRRGAHLDLVGTPYAVPPGSLATKGGTPFKVFTPFSRAWVGHGWPAPLRAPSAGSVRWLDPADLGGEAVPPDPADLDAALPDAGEAAAKAAARRFWDTALDDYHQRRDRMGDERGTSRLSAHLKFGTIHPRQLLARLDARRPGHATFRSELCWREFYADVLLHRPDMAWRSLDPSMRSMEVDTGPLADERFDAWRDGRTGYPVVDAAMRQLRAEGWMHNRARMLTASFLVKDLHLDWQRGAAWFLDRLVDGDLASNQHGWQWAAGTGTDASPYVRVFNPTTQGKRFDPEGTYVRRWVPELAAVEDRHVHEPWTDPAGPPPGYPPPVVDHATERAEALRRFSALRPGTPG